MVVAVKENYVNSLWWILIWEANLHNIVNAMQSMCGEYKLINY